MKNVMKVLLLISLVLLSGTMISAASAAPWPTLPPNAVTMSVVSSSATYLDVTLTGVPSGYSVVDGVYAGWCSDWSHNIGALPKSYQVYLYDTLGSSLPSSVASTNWNEVNYILNNKQGTGMQVQEAIWYIVSNVAPPSTDTDALAMISGALAHPTFQPIPGDIQAIICLTQDWLGTPSSSSVQPVLIELRIPTVTPFTPTVFTLLSATTITLGQSVHDVATVTGTSGFPAPTGSVTFWVSTDANTWSQVGGSVPLVGNTATSAEYTPSAIGTYYFQARYSGDNNYNAASSGAREELLTVSCPKKSSCVYTFLCYGGCGSPNIGDSVNDYAFVTAGATGQVRFEVSVNGAPFQQYGTLKTLSGYFNVVKSDDYTLTVTGTYYFRAVYLGDAKYLGSQSGNTDEPLTVSKGKTCTSTCLSDCSITLGKSVTDTAYVSSGATGQVRFEVSTNGINFAQFGAVKTLSGGKAISDSYTPATTGTYYFRAVYLGDDNHLGSQSGNKEEPLCVKSGQKCSNVWTCLSACSISLGKSVTDTAYVTYGATGQVRFEVSTDGINFVQYGAIKTLSSSYPNTAKSDAFTPTKTGTYYFRAVYLGDVSYLGSQSGNRDEPLCVTSGCNYGCNYGYYGGC
jgi:hypothetical protein